MSRAKWEPANLQPEPGFCLLPSLLDAVRYRGLVFYGAYDMESNTFWSDDWEVFSERTGEVIMSIRADEDRAYDIATRLAEMLNWEGIDEAGWKVMTLDPAFLSFMATYYDEVSIPMLDVRDLDVIVPYGDTVAGSWAQA